MVETLEKISSIVCRVHSAVFSFVLPAVDEIYPLCMEQTRKLQVFTTIFKPHTGTDFIRRDLFNHLCVKAYYAFSPWAVLSIIGALFLVCAAYILGKL